jgi:molecular chaperone HscB
MQIAGNYFELFGFEAKFDVDTELLKQRYREFQKLTHPDKFVNSSESQRITALRQAGYINDAYQTLLSSIARAKYLLKLRGRDLANDTSTIADASFLMEQMELREALADVRQAKDPRRELQASLSTIQRRIDEIEAQLRHDFAQNDAARLSQLATTVKKYQFFVKLREEALDLELDLEA